MTARVRERSDLLVVRDLDVGFETRAGLLNAVHEVTFAVGEGEVLGIVGESGSGKSVSSRALLGLIRPPGKVLGGEVWFRGKDLLKASEKELDSVRGNQIGIVFQDAMSSLNPVVRIGKQIIEVYRAHRHVSRQEAGLKAEEMLGLVGLPNPDMQMRRYPHELSGGMQQRVLMAMTLVAEPDLLIADEPTTALDVTVQAQILELFRDLISERGMALIFVTHDIGVIADLADTVAVMYNGRIVEQGDVREVLLQPAHPYTRGLLSATPRTTALTLPSPIPGTPPRIEEIISGCSFHPRCSLAVAACEVETPRLVPLSVNHKAACPVTAGALSNGE